MSDPSLVKHTLQAEGGSIEGTGRFVGQLRAFPEGFGLSLMSVETASKGSYSNNSYFFKNDPVVTCPQSRKGANADLRLTP